MFRLLRRDHVLHADFDVFYPAGGEMICLRISPAEPWHPDPA